MTVRLRRLAPAAGCLLLLLLIGTPAVATGCSSGESTTTASSTGASTETSTTGTTTGGTPTTEATSSTTLPSQLSEWDRQLRDNAVIQHDLSSYLLAIDAPDDDPLMGLYFGLQARTRALTCRKALAEGDLELADKSMLDVRYAMNLAANVAQGAVAERLAEARAIAETFGAPSGAPDQAAASLDQVLEALAPLQDETVAILSTTTTSAG